MPGNPRPDIWVSRVEASKHTNGTAFATVTAHRFAHYKPYVYKTTDFGRTWTNITNNLPDGHPMYVVKQDTKNPDLLFAGSEFAAFYSINGGQSWHKLNNNLPTVAVHDLLIHPSDGDLIAGTHGRGLWIMDDISPLQQLTADVRNAPAHLFQPRTATQWLNIQPQHNGGEISFIGQNPTRNAVISYHLGAQVSCQVQVEVADITGRNTCSASFPARAGINRVEWAMRGTRQPARRRHSRAARVAAAVVRVAAAAAARLQRASSRATSRPRRVAATKTRVAGSRPIMPPGINGWTSGNVTASMWPPSPTETSAIASPAAARI